MQDAQFNAGVARREFLRSGARQAAAVGLAGLTWLAWRGSGPGAEACRRTFGCGQCPGLGACDLPRATDWRKSVGRSQP